MGVDSVVNTDFADFRLLPDGELIGLHGTQPAGSFTIRTDRVCGFDDDGGRFRALPGVIWTRLGVRAR